MNKRKLNGAVSIEYVVLLVCIALASLVAFGCLGKSIGGVTNNTKNMITEKVDDATNESLSNTTADPDDGEPTYEIVDGDGADGKHYHNDELYSGECGGKLYTDGELFSGTHTDEKLYAEGVLFTGDKDGYHYDEGVKGYQLNTLYAISGLFYYNGELANGTYGGKSYVDGVEQPAYLSLDDKFVGYYADTDGDGTADGVIFFDYAHGATTDAGYLGAGVAVSAKTSGLANYKLIGNNIVQKVGSGDDRFYVIDLEDTKPTSGDASAHWYYSASISDYSTVASTAFGTGKTNTATMKAAWEAETYGVKNDRDMFSTIPDGKFVLSTGEWRVLGSELKKVSTAGFDGVNFILPLTTDAGANLSLGFYCWSSSLGSSDRVWYANFSNGSVLSYPLTAVRSVRLASTF